MNNEIFYSEIVKQRGIIQNKFPVLPGKMNNEISYSEIVKQRGIIQNKFPVLQRKPRNWNDYQCDGNVLSFGSGNIHAANNRELSAVYKNIHTCDSDTTSGADYNNINNINQKFDLVICEHVLEHIDIQDIVGGLAKKLFDISNKNSKLVIGLPNINNFGSFFSHYDHKNFAPPIDIAAIFCCVGYDIIDFYKWSKINHMVTHSQFNDTEKYLSMFLEKHYSLEIDRYITMVFEKHG